MKIFIDSYFFIFGLLIGSFLNVVILRLPLKKDLVFQRSQCPKCLHKLPWYQNVPLFSFVFLKGKCWYCKNKISWRYPLIELLTGLVSLWLVPDQLGQANLAIYAFQFTVACIFICHFLIDLDHHLLLDSLNLYLLAIIFSYVLLTFPWQYWALGGLLGFFAPFLVTWAFYKLRGKVGLGGGDIKLFGILGLLLGPTGIMLNIFLSSFVGALIGLLLIFSGKMNKEKPMAFGPSILIVAAFQIYFPTLAHKVQTLLF